jgi:hypothetical protein
VVSARPARAGVPDQALSRFPETPRQKVIELTADATDLGL